MLKRFRRALTWSRAPQGWYHHIRLTLGTTLVTKCIVSLAERNYLKKKKIEATTLNYSTGEKCQAEERHRGEQSLRDSALRLTLLNALRKYVPDTLEHLN